EANKTGALVSRIMSDVVGVRNLIGTGLVDFVGGLFTAVIAFGLLVRINTVLTFLALGFLLVFGLILRKAFKSIRPIFRERGKINAEVTGRLTESLAGVRVVKGFHAEEREAAVFEAGAFRLFENVRRTSIRSALCSSIVIWETCDSKMSPSSTSPVSGYCAASRLKRCPARSRHWSVHQVLGRAR